MFGLYDVNWNIIDVFDSRTDAFNAAVDRGVDAFKIEEL